MKSILKAIFFTALSFQAIISMQGCGSGGGSDDGGSTSLNTNSCSLLGLGNKSTQLKSYQKIVNGTVCSDNNSPVVLIAIENGDSVAGCTGTLLTNTKVLTAAHCLLGGYGRIIVANGEDGVAVGVSRVAIHPLAKQTSTGVEHDVAILTLSKALSLPTLPLISSIDLKAGDIVSIYGYGSTGGSDEQSDLLLRSGQMRVSSFIKDIFTSNFDGSNGSNTCFGDSGGPAIFTGTRSDGNVVTGIVGVTSTGTNETCLTGDQSGFALTQEQSNLDFIRDNVSGLRIE